MTGLENTRDQSFETKTKTKTGSVKTKTKTKTTKNRSRAVSRPRPRSRGLQDCSVCEVWISISYLSIWPIWNC